MKMKKISLFIFDLVTILIFIPTKVNALVARIVYNPVNVFISNIMKNSPIVLIIVYIISAVIYYIKSKNDKKDKVKKLAIYLIIIVIISIISYFCANIVLEAGATYSSSSINDFIK